MSGMSIILMIPVSGGVSAPSYGVTGPSTGVALAASTNFTVTGYNLTGPVIVTPASDDPGGSFTPATVTINVGDAVKTYTYTPDGSVGTHTISFTNNGGLTNPASLTYEVTAAGGGTSGSPIGLLLALTQAA
jgi:plastocyanin